MSVLVLERYPVSTAATTEFEELLGPHLETLRSQPGVLWADGGRGADEGGYLVCSEWRTGPDLQAWEASEAAASWEAAVDPLLAGDVARRLFDPRQA